MSTEITIKDLLPEALRESLTELHVEKLQEAFDAAVEKKVQNQIAIAVKAAEADFDAQVNERLERLVTKMEEANKADMGRVMKSLNERVQSMKSAYEKRISSLVEQAKTVISEKQKLVKEANTKTRKAQSNLIKENGIAKRHLVESLAAKDEEAKRGVISVAKHFRNQIKEDRQMAVSAMRSMKKYYTESVRKDSQKFKNTLIESIGAYLDREIEKRVPYESIVEACRNRSAMKLVESLRDVLCVDAASTMEVIKAPINEARQMITESENKNAELLTENQKLHEMIAEKNELIEKQMNESKEQIAKAKAALKEAKRVSFLNEKLSTLPSTEQRQFMKNIMASQPIEFIKENWDYATKQYRARVQKENGILAERAKAQRQSSQMAEVSRRRLTEASRSVREAKAERQRVNENVTTKNQIDSLIE